eukprot:scaffold23658_cov97-Isochrysis_galbana.AAC.5
MRPHAGSACFPQVGPAAPSPEPLAALRRIHPVQREKLPPRTIPLGKEIRQDLAGAQPSTQGHRPVPVDLWPHPGALPLPGLPTRIRK